jgi:hypothetical protein
MAGFHNGYAILDFSMVLKLNDFFIIPYDSSLINIYYSLKNFLWKNFSNKNYVYDPLSQVRGEIVRHSQKKLMNFLIKIINFFSFTLPSFNFFHM